jgi:hypothetical protein
MILHIPPAGSRPMERWACGGRLGHGLTSSYRCGGRSSCPAGQTVGVGPNECVSNIATAFAEGMARPATHSETERVYRLSVSLVHSSQRCGRKQTPLAYQVELDQPAAADTCSARQSAMDLGTYSHPYTTDTTCSALLQSHISRVCRRFIVS